MQVRPSHDVLRLRAFIRSARDVPVMCEDHNLWAPEVRWGNFNDRDHVNWIM